MENDEYIGGPKEGYIQRIAMSTTGATTALGIRLKGKGWIRAKAVGVNIQLKFGPSTMTQVVLNTAGGGAGAAEAVGEDLLSGETQHFFLTGDCTHVSWDADAIAGYLVLTRAGRQDIQVKAT